MYVFKRLFKYFITYFLVFFCFLCCGLSVQADELKELELNSSFAWYDADGKWVSAGGSPVTVPVGSYSVRIQVKLSDALKKGDIYDIKLEFDHMTNNNLSLSSYRVADSGGNTIADFSASTKFVTSATHSELYLYDCTYNSADVVYIVVNFDDVVTQIPNSSSGTLYFSNIKVFAQNITTESAVKNILQAVLKIPTDIANGLKGFFQNIVSALDGLKTHLGSLIENVISGLVTLGTNIVNGITSALTVVKDALAQLLQNIVDGLVTLGTFIIDGIKGLFVPEDGYFEDWFTDFDTYFEQKLGFLYFPFDLLTTILDAYVNLGNGSGVIQIPAYEIDGVNLWSETNYDLKAAFTNILGENYNLYYSFVDTIMILMFVRFCQAKWESIIYGSAPAVNMAHERSSDGS